MATCKNSCVVPAVRQPCIKNGFLEENRAALLNSDSTYFSPISRCYHTTKLLIIQALSRFLREPKYSATFCINGTMVKLDKEQVLALMKKIHFFKEFTEEEKSGLASLQSQLINYGPDERIIREGEIDISLFVLLKGTVRVTCNELPRIDIIKLKTGAVFGEISFISKRPRSTNVIAEDKVLVLKIDGVLFDEISFEVQVKIKDKLVELLIQRLDDMNHVFIHHIRYNPYY